MNFFREADVVVIGGGIIGTAILRELSRYQLKSVLLEATPDVATGTTKANSAICHAGFDAPVGSLKAKMNVRGNELYHKIQKELHLDIKWIGSLVVATTEEELKSLKELKERGEENGVPGLKLLSKKEVLAEEPNLVTALGALKAPTAGVMWPFGVALAFAQSAVINGAEIITNCRATGFVKDNGRICAVNTAKGSIKTRYVINAAGVYADEVARLAGDNSFTIHPRKGEYILFDKSAASQLVSGICFPCPSKTSKGILVCTTTHGNTFIGPNANDQDDREDTSVTLAGMDEIMRGGRKLVPNLPMGASITVFGGLRAVSSTGDFVMGKSCVQGFYNAAGMQSPGLSSAPAVAEAIVAAIGEEEPLRCRDDWQAELPETKLFKDMTAEERTAALAKDNRYGRVICRCETVTEGDIIAAIHAPVGAMTVDAVKRRTRAGMGRCQGGFCGPRVALILARELGIPVTEVLKERAGSELYYDKFAARGEN